MKAQEPPLSQDRQETKEKLLDAAESLFARKSFDDVSVRELAAAAGVNVAAVNYHFQGKENLFCEVIKRRFVNQRDRALAALNALLNEPDGPGGIAPVIHILVEQYLQGSLQTEEGTPFMMLVTREMHASKGHGDLSFFREMVQPVMQAFSGALLARRPGMTREQVGWCMASIVGQIHHFIMRWHKFQTLGADSPEGRIMISLFPVLAGTVEEYIQQVTDHVTRFSVAAAESLYPEVEE